MTTPGGAPSLAPLREWAHRAAAAPIPASARAYVPSLLDELETALRTGGPEVDQLAADLRGASGSDRRSRALRILDRVGELDRALDALRAARGEDVGG